MDFGATLRAARESKHLTTSEVAAQTRILVQIIEEMEREDFHQIVAPIYGRGFVKLYCECVGLDPQPMIREFMDIYEGKRTPVVRTRPLPPPEPTIEEPPQSSAPPMPEPPIGEQLLSSELPPISPIELAPSSEPPVTEDVAGLALFDRTAESEITSGTPISGIVTQNSFDDEECGDSRLIQEEDFTSPAEKFRRSLSNVSSSIVSSAERIPKPVIKIALIALLAAVVIWLLCLGVNALLRATASSDSDTPPPAPVRSAVKPGFYCD